MQSSVPTTGFMSLDQWNPAGYTIRFTRAAPALPTSSSTWPISRRSAPFTGAKSSLGRRAAARFAFFGAAFLAALPAVLRGAARRAADFFFGAAARVLVRRDADRAERFLAMRPR